MRARLLAILTFGGLIGGGAVGVARAQVDDLPAPPVLGETDAREWLRTRLGALDSPDIRARDGAQEEIRTGPVGLRHVEEVLLAARRGELSLSAEQRERLRAVALERFSDEPRAAMGVQFGGNDFENSGVRIGAVVPGFDAQRVLRAGDVIVSMDGRDVATTRDVRASIVSHDPGEEVGVGLVRRGERLDVRVRLGSLSDLANASAKEDIIGEAWELRAARGGAADDSDTIVPDASQDRFDTLYAQAPFADQEKQVGPRVQAGNGVVWRNVQPREENPGVTLVAAGAGRARLETPPTEFSLSAALSGRDLNPLVLERNQIRLQVRELEVMQKQAGLAERQRQKVRQALDQLRNKQAVLDAQIKQVQQASSPRRP